MKVSWHENLCVIAFLAISGKQVLPWQHCFMLLGLKSLSWGSLHSKPLHRLELICLTTITGNTLPWQHFFLFIGLINIFMGSLLSMPLCRLELISLSATPGNNCCHSNTFSCFLGLKVFLGVLYTPNHCMDWSGLAFQ